MLKLSCAQLHPLFSSREFLIIHSFGKRGEEKVGHHLRPHLLPLKTSAKHKDFGKMIPRTHRLSVFEKNGGTDLLEWRKSYSSSSEMVGRSLKIWSSCEGTCGKRFQDENIIAKEKEGGREMCFLWDTSIRDTCAGKAAISRSKKSKSLRTWQI